MLDQIERPLLGRPRGIDLVDPPQQPVDGRGAVFDQVITPVDQQLQLPRGLVMGSDRQIGLTQRGPGNSSGVDRVRLSARAGDAALLGHHLRRHPHHPLASGQQVPFQPGGQVTAVLDGPHQIVPELLAGPRQRLQVPLGDSRDGDLPDLPTHGIDRDERVRALVDIGSNNNHGGCLLH